MINAKWMTAEKQDFRRIILITAAKAADQQSNSRGYAAKYSSVSCLKRGMAASQR